MTIKARWEVPIPECSLQQWIFGSSREALSDRKAFLCADRPETHFFTMTEYRQFAKRIAIGLLDAGLKPGDRVLVYSGNNLYFPCVFLGILMAGAVFTGANPTFTPRELAYQLQDSGASFLLTADGSLPTALEAAKQVGLPRDKIYLFDSPDVPRSNSPSPGRAGRKEGMRHWTELLQGNKSRAETWDWTEPRDPITTTCCLNYSSGTTGVPKGVEITHHSYIANGVGVVFVSDLDAEARAKRDTARGLCFLPLYHAYAQTYFVANYARMGIPTYIMPQFDFVKMLQHVQDYRITSLTCVPPIVVALAKHPLARKYDLSSVDAIGSGAAPLAREVIDEVEKLFPGRDLTVRQGWGMTELTCTCISWDPTEPAQAAGVGELMPNCAARLMELDGVTEITAPHRPGEIWVTGPTLMKGYWNRPDATAATMSVDADGTRWLRTGDIGYVDRHAPGAVFFIVDRLKELIKVKGNQVAPAELEGVLLERPDLADAAVVGVTIGGEEYPRAYVVRAPGAPGRAVTEHDVVRWMEGKVARHKRLKGGVCFVDSVPKNPSGKILRKFLRERAAKEVGDRKDAKL